MKIVIAQGGMLPVPPLNGGAVEKLWFALGKQFATQGHEVTHISRSWPGLPPTETIAGVKHVRVKGISGGGTRLALMAFDFFYTLRIIRALPSDADVVVTNNYWSPILLPLFRRVAVYVSVERMPKGQMRWYRNAARLRAPSLAVADAIKRELPEARYESVTVVPNPLPFEPPGDDRFLQSKEQVILYCGRVHPEKGLHLLANLVSRLPCGWTLRIVGPWDTENGGGGEAYYRDLNACFGKHANVQFTGAIFDTEQLNTQYRKAAIFVYPSVAEQGEAFGLAPLEAMAWGGVPVVSALDCFKDYMVDGVNGFVFDHRAAVAPEQLADKVIGLIENESGRHRFARSALKIRDSHAPARVAKMFLDDFSSLINNER